jgi:hypothetical protein
VGKLCVAHLLAKESKPFSVGEFVRKCLQHIVQEIWKKELFNTVSLSYATMTQQVEDISSDLLNQLRNKAKEFESFCLVLDENNDTSDTAQLLIVIQGITECFEVVKKLGSLISLYGTTREDFFLVCVCETVKELEHPWTKLRGVAANRSPSIIGKKTSLINRIRQ